MEKYTLQIATFSCRYLCFSLFLKRFIITIHRGEISTVFSATVAYYWRPNGWSKDRYFIKLVLVDIDC